MQPIYISARAAISGARFDVVAYRGDALKLGGWDLPLVVDLAGLKPAKTLVANLDHDDTKRVGHADEVENDGRELRLRGVLSAATPYRDEVLNSYKAGYLWEASVEVNPTKIEEVKFGHLVNVNGRPFEGPLYVTRRGVLMGFAFVSHGADNDTSVSIAASRRRFNEASYVSESSMLTPRTVSQIMRWIS